jgi:hypothetical protein
VKAYIHIRQIALGIILWIDAKEISSAAAIMIPSPVDEQIKMLLQRSKSGNFR